MVREKYILLSAIVVLLTGLAILTNCESKDIRVDNETIILPQKLLYEDDKPESRVIKEGTLCCQKDTIGIVRDGDIIAIIKISEPIAVAQAEEEYEWGYFQFPTLYRNERGHLVVEYQLKPDSYTAYGEDSNIRMVSIDDGKTWRRQSQPFFKKDRYRVEMSNGDVLQVCTPKAKDINSYQSFPRPLNTSPLKNGYNFYYECELPNELRGAYLTYWSKKNEKVDTIHSIINDPGLLRYSINDFMPVVWWGNIKELSDKSLIAGIYPGYYLNSRGEVLTSATSFYLSKDKGRNWNLLGKIPFQEDGEVESFTFSNTDKEMSEPTFEVLKDGTLLCVMRTWGVFPMYKSFSKNGIEWSKPEYFTPNGVMPELSLLDNGVLVLASGRPGIQIRFSVDGDGRTWTLPIDMIPFMNGESDYDIYVSCGYPSLLKKSFNSFYIVYSDFTTKDNEGNIRKSIILREVEIDKI